MATAGASSWSAAAQSWTTTASIPARTVRTGRSTSADAEQFGMTESIGDYNTRLRIGVDKVWTTPTEG